MKLIVFGADDGAKLALVARSPSSFNVVRNQLDGQALRVALVIVGQGADEMDDQVKATAKFFSDWAAQNFQQRTVVAALT